jgi:hypothetical protein
VQVNPENRERGRHTDPLANTLTADTLTIVEDLNLGFLDLKGAKDLTKSDIADAYSQWGEIYLGNPIRGRDETQQDPSARERSRDRGGPSGTNSDSDISDP